MYHKLIFYRLGSIVWREDPEIFTAVLSESATKQEGKCRGGSPSRQLWRSKSAPHREDQRWRRHVVFGVDSVGGFEHANEAIAHVTDV